MFNIEEELKKLPNKPGVYIMHDKDDNIIYVGKAVSLKNRVRQYFRKNKKIYNLIILPNSSKCNCIILTEILITLEIYYYVC